MNETTTLPPPTLGVLDKITRVMDALGSLRRTPQTARETCNWNLQRTWAEGDKWQPCVATDMEHALDGWLKSLVWVINDGDNAFKTDSAIQHYSVKELTHTHTQTKATLK